MKTYNYNTISPGRVINRHILVVVKCLCGILLRMMPIKYKIMKEELIESGSLAEAISMSIDQQIVGLSYISSAMNEVYSAATGNASISNEVQSGADLLNESIDTLQTLVRDWQAPDFYQD